MTTAKVLLWLTPLALGLAVCLPTLAETPQQVQQRLDQYRQQDEAAAKRRAEQQLEAAQRRELTLQWQEERRREEYARRWKCYGAREIDVLLWRQQKDGTWVTSAKVATGAIACVPDKPPEGDLGTRPRLQPWMAGDRFWVKVRASISIEQLASALAQDESRLARLNDVDEDHKFQRGDWLVLPRQSLRTVEQVAPIDTSELRHTPPLEAPVSPVRTRFILGLKPIASAGLAWPVQPRFGSVGTGPTFSVDQLIGVNCTSLMVNRKLPYEGWERWVRPGKDSADEQLVIDRCTTSKP